VREDRLEGVLEQEGRDDADGGGEDDEPEQPRQAPLVGEKSGRIRRRFARRTAGSAGRSAGASDE